MRALASRRRVPFWGVVLAGVTVCGCSSIGDDGGQHVRFAAPFNPSGEEVPRVSVGAPITTEGFMVCLDAPGSAELTAVVPVGASGLEVTDFAVRPNPYTRGGELADMYGSLPAKYFVPGHRTVDRPCGKPGDSTDIGIEVVRTGDAVGRATSFRIEYRSGTSSRHLDLPYELVLCPTTSKSPSCALHMG